MDPRTILTRGVSTGLRLGRGTADRLVTLAGPPMGRIADQVISRVRRHESPPPTTTTFTPSKHGEQSVPSPAVVARNIGPQRPVAKPARAPRPKNVPGAKLPPPRPSTS
ncbi:hypothetical protein [Nocardioides halotolerans]|jgi:hypothetical protein|uniref:hypothetical protein n=1 Tax=Nocardioides halotolerans TaxID=433660 RepID=UPI000404BEAD|nr:hypothetical protein [Nocardioides halotolerans]